MQSYNVLVVGSFSDAKEAEEIAKQLGREMMSETSFTLVSGGLGKREPGKPDAVDRFVLEAAKKTLEEEGTSPELRIMTMLPEKEDPLKKERLKIGRTVTVPSSNLRTRRYKMVLNSDAVIAFGGGKATKQMLELAYVAGKPILPLISTGGSAKNAWEDHEPELVEIFNASDDDVRILKTPGDPEAIVGVCLQLLKRVLRPCCFVAMPFSRHPLSEAFAAIRSTIKNMGYRLLRVDEETDLFQGDIVQTIWDAIRRSDVVIADLSDHRPNVYYELGISHALSKPTCLIIHNRDGKIPNDIPFDIRVQHILPYSDADHLHEQLKSSLDKLDAKRCETV